MKWIKYFENHRDKTLIIVDVQKSFKKFFHNNINDWSNTIYLQQLQNYCKQFKTVYQIWDNHINGRNVDKDYLYHDEPAQNETEDIYDFVNQVDLIEKRYNYDVSVSFYKKILNPDVFNTIKKLEEEGHLNKGDVFPTNEGTIIVYIGNNHKWFHCPKKLHNLLESLSGKEVVLVGGAKNECLEDIITLGESLGVNIKIDRNFVYSAF